MKDEAVRKEPKKRTDIQKLASDMGLPKVKYAGTGVYTPPADAAEREREGN